MTPTVAPIVDCQFLADHPEAVIADVRWYLDGRSGYDAFLADHISGAVWVDLDSDLSCHDLAADEGRHPLPDPEHFAQAMSRLGIADESLVVAYDDAGGLSAGRLVVMLRMLGVNAALLNGGFAAWQDQQRTTDAGSAPAAMQGTTPGFTARPFPTESLANPLVDQAVLLDARSRERFVGQANAVDPRPGHIPGARSAPWSAVLNPDGTFRSAQDLQSYFAALGVTDETSSSAIAYCGSGVSACMNILAAERAGFRPLRLYVASWSGWSANPRNLVQTGE